MRSPDPRAVEAAPRCRHCGQVIKPKPPPRYVTFRCSECEKHCAVTVKRGRRRVCCSHECYLARKSRRKRQRLQGFAREFAEAAL